MEENVLIFSSTLFVSGMYKNLQCLVHEREITVIIISSMNRGSLYREVIVLLFRARSQEKENSWESPFDCQPTESGAV